MCVEVKRRQDGPSKGKLGQEQSHEWNPLNSDKVGRKTMTQISR